MMALGVLPGRRMTPAQEEEQEPPAFVAAVAGSAGSELETAQAGI